MVKPAMTTNTLADEEKETLNEVEGKKGKRKVYVGGCPCPYCGAVGLLPLKGSSVAQISENTRTNQLLKQFPSTFRRLAVDCPVSDDDLVARGWPGGGVSGRSSVSHQHSSFENA